jgi:drug/metabolite transporter superfamily protein YnfA
MKRFLKVLKRNAKPILKATLILALAIIAYILAHKAGTAERGYEAVGGEMFVPFLIIFAEDIWEIIKSPFKEVKSNVR